METEVNQTGTSVQDVADRLANRWAEQEAAVEPEAKPEEVEAESEAASEEVVAEPEGEVVAQTDEPESTEEETPFQTVYELADALEITPEEFLASIKGKVKVNGEESEVTLAEALKGYQLDADYRRKTTEVADERRLVEQSREEILHQAQDLQQKLNEVNLLSDIATNAIMAEFNDIDWGFLKENNREEYLIRQQDYNSRMQQVQQAKQAATAQFMQIQQARLAEALPKQAAAMKRAIPEWENEDTMKAEQKQVSEYLKNAGYSPEEISGLYDHRAVVVARKAMLYDMATSKHNKAADPEKTTVRKVTKNLKSGARKQSATIKQEAIKKARARLRKTGSKDDAAALLLSRWNS